MEDMTLTMTTFGIPTSSAVSYYPTFTVIMYLARGAGVETVVDARSDVGRLRHDVDRRRRPLEAPPLSEDALGGVRHVGAAVVVGAEPLGGQGTPRPAGGFSRFRFSPFVWKLDTRF